MSGGGLGTGAGGILGSLAGAALAPETGGLSLALPAIGGAAGAELGNVATGNTVNPIMAAFMGGVGGGLSGAAGVGSDLGISNSAGLFGDASGAAGASDAVAADGASFAPLDGGAANTGSAATDNLINGFSQDQAGGGASGDLFPKGCAANSAVGAGPNGTAGGALFPGGGSSSMLGNAGNWVSKNPLQAAMLGETAVSGIQSLLPKPKVNIGQTAAQVEATDPGFNATLPKYKMQNTASPYQGNWYTYGQQPEAAMYNAQPVAQAKGGLIKGYAAGGTVSPGNRVNPLTGVMPRLSNALRSNTPPMHGSRFPTAHGYAMGGTVMPGAMPPQAPPQGMPQQQPAQPNPLQLAAVHKMGVAIGQHLKAHGYDPNKTPDGIVKGHGGGQDDAVPAKLSQDEFIVPADVVAHLGDGSSNEGGKKLVKMLHNVRAEKTKNKSGFPPKAKSNPLAYIKGAT